MNNNIIATIQQIKQNPDQLKQMLYENGKINREQYEAIKPMSSFSDIGNYLVNNNLIPNYQALQSQVKNILK